MEKGGEVEEVGRALCSAQEWRLCPRGTGLGVGSDGNGERESMVAVDGRWLRFPHKCMLPHGTSSITPTHYRLQLQEKSYICMSH